MVDSHVLRFSCSHGRLRMILMVSWSDSGSRQYRSRHRQYSVDSIIGTCTSE